MSSRAAAGGTDRPLDAAQYRRIVRLVFFVALCNMACLRASKVTVALFALKLSAGAFAVGVLIASGVILTGIDLFQFYMPVYGHVIGLSASLIGVVLASFSVASFVVRVFMPKLVRRAGEQKVLMAALALGAATYLLFPFFRDPVLLIVVSFVLGLGLGCGQPLSMMLTCSRSPLGRSGEALGLRITVNNFIHVVAPLAFGSIASAFGMLPVFIGNALMLAGESYRNRPLAIGEKNENCGV